VTPDRPSVPASVPPPRPGTPVVMISGVDDLATASAAMAWQWDLPGSVAVSHRIDPERQQLHRTIVDLTGVLERVSSSSSTRVSGAPSARTSSRPCCAWASWGGGRRSSRTSRCRRRPVTYAVRSPRRTRPRYGSLGSWLRSTGLRWSRP